MLVLSATLFLFRDDVLDFVVDALLWQPDLEMLHDGDLHLVLCGTGGPGGDPSRRPACSAIAAAGELLLVDSGAGTIQYAQLQGLPIEQLSTILVTHLHMDHIGGLGDAIYYSWFQGRSRSVTVYGPPGIDEVVRGFELAYGPHARLMSLPGLVQLDPAAARPQVRVIDVSGSASTTVFERGGLRVRAFAVDHSPIEPAYGYRVDFAGRSIVFSGDSRRDERMVTHARGADILVHSAMGLESIARRLARRLEKTGRHHTAQLMLEAPAIFSSPAEVAEIAARAGVSTLVFSHVPPVPRIGEPIFLWGVSERFGGDVVVGRDGMRFDLTARADPIGPGADSTR